MSENETGKLPDEAHSKQTKIQRLRSFEIHPILPSSLQTDGIELIDGIVLSVTDKSQISSLLRILPPLPTAFGHLKRVNGAEVLVTVGPREAIGSDGWTALSEVLGAEPVLGIRPIPSRKPRSKAQVELYRRKWPMSFHKNTKLESMVNGTLLTDTESARIGELFTIAEIMQGALFYDPANDRIVAEGRTHADKNPVAHAVLNAIEHLSAKQAKRSDDSEKSAQYLATGFYAVLAAEPCTMCAMALVHVRVGRVFFGALNAKFGAFCSKWRLQESPHINHHFDVFRIVEKFNEIVAN